MSLCPKWVLQPQKSALRFFIGQYLSFRGGLLQAPSVQGRGVWQWMIVRNCAASIDVIEKSSGSGSLEQAVDDIKTFANTASFLANKLDTRLKGGEVKAKTKPKSRVGKAIASVPKPNRPKSPSSPPDPSSTNTSGMPTATSIATSQADFDRLKPQSSQPPVGAS